MPRPASLAIAAAFLAATMASAGCGSTVNLKSPSSDGIRTLIAALGDASGKQAFAMLSSNDRRQTTWPEFQKRWQSMKAERAAQVKALTEMLAANAQPRDVASVEVGDGGNINLVRVDSTWLIEKPLVGSVLSGGPYQAMARFADAIEGRDIPGVLATLTRRRRVVIAKQIQSFLKGLAEHRGDMLSEDGPARRTLRFDSGGSHFEIVLLFEDGEWRIDDIVTRSVGTEERIDEGFEFDDEDSE